jgi:hypothetical protein
MRSALEQRRYHKNRNSKFVHHPCHSSNIAMEIPELRVSKFVDRIAQFSRSGDVIILT